MSVILCARNAVDVIGEQLQALAEQTYQSPWELVVVDDGSTDGTNGVVRTFEDRIHTRIVQTPNPGGLARARNVGAAAAAGEFLVFCDADDIADVGWLDAMVRAADGFAAVGGHLEEERLNDPVVRQWRPALTDGDLPGAFGMVKVPVGANCAVWKGVYSEVGGFEERLNFTGEEVDFFWRVILAGHEIRYAPDAIMHYRHRDTLNAVRRQAFSYGRGTIALYVRYRHLGLRPTTVRDTLRFGFLVAKGVPGAAISRARRGAWLRFTWFLAGQAVESRRQHVWHLG